MSKLAEIAAQVAKEAATTNWTGRHVTANVTADAWAATGTAIQADADEPNTVRAEIHAAPHLMPVNGGEVHYGTPDSYGNTDLPICRQGHGNHRISYYRAVTLPVTCANCTGRHGTEA